MQPKQKTTEYKIPHSGPAREALRVKGQFWTPAWVADAMVWYALADQCKTLFDPAVGAGAFFVAAKKIDPTIKLRGFDVDAEVLQTPNTELSPADFANVKIADFILAPPAQKLPAIEQEGHVNVDIVGRPFPISWKFIQDLEKQNHPGSAYRT